MKTITKLWLGVLVLTVLSPLGLILPEYFKAGSAWGEWGVDQIQELSGYIPKGLERLSWLWNAPIPGYTPRGWEDKGLGGLSLGYIISAALGIAAVVIVMLIIGKALSRKSG